MSEILSAAEGHTDADVQATVDAHDKVVLMFSGQTCPPCRRLYPIFNQLALSTPTIKFAKVDVEEFMQASNDFDIKRMPTFLFYAQGRCVNKIEGGGADLLTKAVYALAQTQSEESLLDKYAAKK